VDIGLRVIKTLAMATAVRSKLEERVVNAAERALVDRHFVTAIDVLVGVGWLTTPQVDQWRRGQVDFLERLVTANLSKISTAMATFRHEEEALAQAEIACLADQDARARRRKRQVEHRSTEDDSFKDSLSKEIIRLFPGCSQERAEAIAAHSGARRSGRVGRSAAGRALDPEAVTLAVVASVRHEDTDYDQLLMSGVPRADARDRVRSDIQNVLDAWRTPDGRS
jgi:hypothetical protein